jgi:hypothetical protein
MVPIRLHASADDESSHLAFWHDFWADTALRRQQAFCRQPAPELVRARTEPPYPPPLSLVRGRGGGDSRARASAYGLILS